MKIQSRFLIALLLSFVGLQSSLVFADEKRGSFASPIVNYVHPYKGEGLDTRRTVVSYSTGSTEVVGTTTAVHFTLNLPVKQVWPIFQDFSLWQGQVGLSHTSPYGDKEGDIEFLIYSGPREEASLANTMAFVVEMVVPEHLIVTHSPLWEGIDAKGNRLGYKHEGKNAFMLTEVDGKTIVTASMEHTFHFHGPNRQAEADDYLAKKLASAKKSKTEIWQSFVTKMRELLNEKK